MPNPDLQNYITQSRRQKIIWLVGTIAFIFFISLAGVSHAQEASLGNPEIQASILSTTNLQASFWGSIGNFFKNISKQITNNFIQQIVQKYIPTFHLPISDSRPAPTKQAVPATQPKQETPSPAPEKVTPGETTAPETPNPGPEDGNPTATPTPSPILSSSPLPQDTGFIQGEEEKYLTPCNAALKYFPASIIGKVIGPVKSSYVAVPTGNKALGINSYTCSFIIKDPPGGLASANVVEYKTIAEAKDYFSRQPKTGTASMGVGDEGFYSSGLALNSFVRKGRYVFSVSWWCFCSTKQTLSSSQAENIFRYAIAQVPSTQATPTLTPGPSAIIETGTEYLKRKFAGTPVTFYGDWPDPAPNREIINLELMVNNGLAFIEKPNYKSLNIQIHIYEPGYWKTQVGKYCSDSLKTLGCSQRDNIIHASAVNISGMVYNGDEYYTVDKIIIHEAVHKLYNNYVGTWAFLPVPHIFNPAFIDEWRIAFGTVNDSACKYLPIIDTNRWNDGDKFTPHCGFARAYGASEYLNGNLAKRYGEDVTTFIEQLYFNSNFSSQGDVPTDPRYKQKETILRKYGFL